MHVIRSILKLSLSEVSGQTKTNTLYQFAGFLVRVVSILDCLHKKSEYGQLLCDEHQV